MNDLRELIGQTVKASIGQDDKGITIEIKCKIINVYIDDFYFQHKPEPIYIRVDVEPIEQLPRCFDWGDLSGIFLDHIRK